MTRPLTPTEVTAIQAFKEDFVPKAKRLGYYDWRTCLYEAWLNDWPEQRGVLRALRNDPAFIDLTAILQQFERQSSTR
jgi:hypothetical protein